MELLLPAEIGDGRLDTILRLFHQIGRSPQKGLKVNWSRVERVTPAGTAIFACLFDSLVEHRIEIRHLYVKKKIRESPVVQKLMLASDHRSLPPPDFMSQSYGEGMLEGYGQTLGISFADRVIQLIAPQMHDDLRFSLKLVLNELMINSVDHSSSERYYLYAGRWGAEFHAGVLDMGVSIPAKLSQKYAFDDDCEALRLCLKEGVSTRRGRTGGLGLLHTVESMKSHKGRLTIVSRGAELRKYFHRRKTDVTPLKFPLAGTWCFVRFPWKIREMGN